MMTPPMQFSAENYTKVIMKMNNDRIDEITDAIKKLGEELKLPRSI